VTENRWLPKSSIASAIAPHTVSISQEYNTWHGIVQYVFDVQRLTNELRDALCKSDASGSTFDDIRKKNGNRHEFSNIQLLNVSHITSAEKETLQQLGFRFSQ
jgi:hypothetical protein